MPGLPLFPPLCQIALLRTLYADDNLVILAWVMLLGSSIMWQINTPMLYEQYAVRSGHKLPTPDFMEWYHAFIKTTVVYTLPFYSCLWTVKLSFLIFFRRLGVKVTRQRVWWWVVLVLVVGSWVDCVADLDYQCTLGSMKTIQGEIFLHFGVGGRKGRGYTSMG